MRWASAASLLQWLLLPRLGAIQRLLPFVQFALHNLRTSDIISRLQDKSLQLGLVRDSAIKRPLAKESLCSLSYALFAPRPLVPAERVNDMRWIFETLPFAGLQGRGEFEKGLEEGLKGTGINRNLRLLCESLPQVFRAVELGQYAGILPDIAEPELPSGKFLRLEIPFLKTQTRQICLAWDPRSVRLTPKLEKVINELRRQLRAETTQGSSTRQSVSRSTQGA